MSRVLPILFNTDMVRAILDGRKTETRRICKDGDKYVVPDMGFYNKDKRTYAVHIYSDPAYKNQIALVERTCPVCPGDILYVRETWNETTHGYNYKASPLGNSRDSYDWRPSIHMPKEAARIWLRVMDVRVERLQAITEEQAKAEGAVRCYEEIRPEEDTPVIYQSGDEGGYYTLGFKALWNSLTRKQEIDGWDANPWVWVIKFEQCEKPESEEI